MHKLKISSNCGNNCNYCGLFNIKCDIYRSYNDIVNELKNFESNTSKIVLPCNFDIRDDALDILKITKDKGFRITLESNGRIFYFKNNAEEYIIYIDKFKIYLNGLKDVHNIISGNDSFDFTIHGIKNLSALKADLQINIVLSELNFSQFDELIALLKKYSIKKIKIIFIKSQIKNFKDLFNAFYNNLENINKYDFEIKNITEHIDFDEIMLKKTSNNSERKHLSTEKKYKILIFAYLTYISGFGQYISNIINYLSDSFEISFIMFNDKIHPDYNSLISKNNIKCTSLKNIISCLNEMESSDIIYISSASSFSNFIKKVSSYILEKLKRTQSKNILTINHPYSKNILNSLDSNLHNYFKYLSFTSKYFDAVDRKIFNAQSKIKQFVLYNPAFEEKRIPKDYKNKKPITIGRISRDDLYKFSEDTIEFYEYLNNYDFKFIFLGAKKSITKLLGNKKVPDNWIIYGEGEIPSEDFFRQTDIFVYKTSSSYVEYFGNVIIEAMYYGIPVVTEKRDAYPEQIIDGKTGFLCSSNEEFYETIIKLKNDENLRETIGKEAQNFVIENFNIEKFRTAHNKIFKDIINNKF
jgi:glycosyltransferase involved in cell wall biosynthesis